MDDPSRCLNRPMLEEDLGETAGDPWARRLRLLVGEYRELGLPVANGELAFSNLVEGPARMLTCHPYRLWEYASLFKVLGDSFRGKSFLDVGGALSPLSFLLAEHGARGRSLELQPVLVCLANHVSQVRRLDLRAEAVDAAGEIGRLEEFDFATCISVVEHVPRPERPRLLRNLARSLKPDGFLYLTFDYGTHVAGSSYRRHEGAAGTPDESLPDLDSVGEDLAEAGLVFLEDDPRNLPAEVLARKSAPRHAAVARRMALTRRPFDAETPWTEVARYIGRRLGLGRPPLTRYARHNFFRLFLTRAR